MFFLPKISSKIENLVKNRKFRQKSKIRSKIKNLLKDRKFGHKSKIRSKTKNLVNNLNIGRNRFFLANIQSSSKFDQKSYFKLFPGELVPYVFHHERGCHHIIHWSGSTSCLKRHLRACDHVGSGVQLHFDHLRRDVDLNLLRNYLDETGVIEEPKLPSLPSTEITIMEL